MNKWLKTVFYVLTCTFALIGLVSVIFYFDRNIQGNSSGIPANSQENKLLDISNAVAENGSLLYYSEPVSIYGSDFKFMNVMLKNDNSGKESFKRANYSPAHTINILFYDNDSQAFNLLFAKRAKIVEMYYPSSKKDTLNSLILYKAITTDTDGNGQLDENDNAELFVSSLTGKELKQVTSSKTNFISFSYIGKNRLLIRVSIPAAKTDKENWGQDYYIYDITEGVLKTDNKFSEELQAVKKIIGS